MSTLSQWDALLLIFMVFVGYGVSFAGGAWLHHRYVRRLLLWYVRQAMNRRNMADTVELPGLQSAARQYNRDGDRWLPPFDRAG